MLHLGMCRSVWMPPFPLPTPSLRFSHICRQTFDHIKYCFKVFRCLCNPSRELEISTISLSYNSICMAIPARHAPKPPESLYVWLYLIYIGTEESV